MVILYRASGRWKVCSQLCRINRDKGYLPFLLVHPLLQGCPVKHGNRQATCHTAGHNENAPFLPFIKMFFSALVILQQKRVHNRNKQIATCNPSKEKQLFETFYSLTLWIDRDSIFLTQNWDHAAILFCDVVSLNRLLTYFHPKHCTHPPPHGLYSADAS